MSDWRAILMAVVAEWDECGRAQVGAWADPPGIAAARAALKCQGEKSDPFDLDAALSAEIRRVKNDVLPLYAEIGLSGRVALAMMETSLTFAAEAMDRNDPADKMAALMALKQYTG